MFQGGRGGGGEVSNERITCMEKARRDRGCPSGDLFRLLDGAGRCSIRRWGPSHPETLHVWRKRQRSLGLMHEPSFLEIHSCWEDGSLRGSCRKPRGLWREYGEVPCKVGRWTAAVMRYDNCFSRVSSNSNLWDRLQWPRCGRHDHSTAMTFPKPFRCSYTKGHIRQKIAWLGVEEGGQDSCVGIKTFHPRLDIRYVFVLTRGGLWDDGCAFYSKCRCLRVRLL